MDLFEAIIIRRYVPSFREGEVDREGQARLAEYLGAVLGVRPVVEEGRPEGLALSVPPTRTRYMERRLGIRLSKASSTTVLELDTLLRAADTQALRRVLREGRKRRERQSRLDDF